MWLQRFQQSKGGGGGSRKATGFATSARR